MPQLLVAFELSVFSAKKPRCARWCEKRAAQAQHHEIGPPDMAEINRLPTDYLLVM